MGNITTYVQTHWLSIMGLVWGVDQLLKVLGGMGFKVADNLADILGNFLKTVGYQPPKQ